MAANLLPITISIFEPNLSPSACGPAFAGLATTTTAPAGGMLAEDDATWSSVPWSRSTHKLVVHALLHNSSIQPLEQNNNNTNGSTPWAAGQQVVQWKPQRRCSADVLLKRCPAPVHPGCPAPCAAASWGAGEGGCHQRRQGGGHAARCALLQMCAFPIEAVVLSSWCTFGTLPGGAESAGMGPVTEAGVTCT